MNKLNLTEAQLDLLGKLFEESGLKQDLQNGDKDNPIIDNRIVSDVTFAARLSHFLDSMVVWEDAASFEEFNYLKMVARKLLDYQKKTAVKEEEKEYLKNVS